MWSTGRRRSRTRSRPTLRSGSPARRIVAGQRRRGTLRRLLALVRFEDAANAIGATGDISIKRFSEGRAQIDMALSEPIDLLRELESRCDLEFEVRSTATTRSSSTSPEGRGDPLVGSVR